MAINCRINKLGTKAFTELSITASSFSPPPPIDWVDHLRLLFLEQLPMEALPEDAAERLEALRRRVDGVIAEDASLFVLLVPSLFVDDVTHVAPSEIIVCVYYQQIIVRLHQ